MNHTNTEPGNLIELNLISHYLFYFCFLTCFIPVFLLYQQGKALQISTFLVVLYHYKINIATVSRSFFSCGWLGQLNTSMGMSLYTSRGKFVWLTYYPKLSITEIYYCIPSAREYYPAKVCGWHFQSLVLRVAFTIAWNYNTNIVRSYYSSMSIGKKLQKWQICLVHYQWIMAVISTFCHYIPLLHFFSILKFCWK